MPVYGFGRIRINLQQDSLHPDNTKSLYYRQAQSQEGIVTRI